MLVLNDLHIGVKRVAGTTQVSSEQLREYLVSQFRRLLLGSPCPEVAINGDMFDTYNVPLNDLFSAYTVCAEFLQEDGARRLYLLPGNHCLSKSSIDLSSFEMMARLLEVRFSGQAVYSSGGAWLNEERGVYGISHVVNQAVFDLALSQVPGGTRYLLLHCNFASPFAEHADHSLNISRDQARDLVDRGITLVLGHEHHQRVLMGGKVVIPGNQVPTSIADCVTPEGRQISEKQFAVLTDEGVTLHQSWRADDEDAGFRQVSIEDEFDPAWRGFIRITGDVMPEDAADALRKISRLRQASNAFVIVNAVKVRSAAGNEIEDALEGIEDVRGIDVIQMLLETLTKEQQEAVRAVLATQK